MLRSSGCGLVLLVAYALAGGASQAKAQSVSTGVLAGLITTGENAPAAATLLTLIETATGITRSVGTNREGRFHFGFLRPGDYRLTIEKFGFVPVRLTEIPVRPGRALNLDHRLQPVGGAEVSLVERSFSGATVGGGLPGSSRWVSTPVVRTLPAFRQNFSDLGRTLSMTDTDVGIEGLPSAFSTMLVDGTSFRPASHPLTRTHQLQATGFDLMSISSAEVVNNGVDVEFAGAAGGFLSAHARPGTPQTQGQGAAHWSGSVLGKSSSVEQSSLSFNDVHGSLLLQMPMLADSARLTVGVSARRVEAPFSRAWAESATTSTLASLSNSWGMNLGEYLGSEVVGQDALTAFGNLDWSVAERHRVRATLHVVSLPRLGVAGRTGLVPEVEGNDLVAGFAIGSNFSDDVDNELRASVTNSLRRISSVSGVPHTVLVEDALDFGDLARAGDVQESVVRFTDALYFRGSRHALKIGAGLSVISNQYNQRLGAEGDYFYGSLDALRNATGVLVRNEGPSPSTDWSTSSFEVFAQDRFSAGLGLELLVGVRADYEPLPTDIRRDTTWYRLTRIANDEPDPLNWRVSPRVGLTWDVEDNHRWIIHAGTGLYYDRLDGLLLSQWRIDDGTGDQRRVVGSVAWPPSATPGGRVSSRLTVLGPTFEPPRTARFTAGMTHRAGENLSLFISGALRHTEKLPRRADLNLLPSANARDQHNRPIFGNLIKQGGLLAGEPGTSRRFSDYDEVAAINADGWSDHYGITVGLDRAVTEGFGAWLQYTFSKTTDNWFGGREGGWTALRPAGLLAGPEWAEGTSDFDTPHRLAAGVIATVIPSLEVTATYRLQSGLPFTPGFRPGVDANGDGSARNDPAFVDEAVAGMNEVLTEWPCLQESVNRFAARNSCRTDAVHSLDARLALRVFSAGGFNTSLNIELLDLLESGQAVPDAALYLVNPLVDLNRQGSTVTVPLLVNPDFGKPLPRRESGRTVRLGFSLNW